MKDILTGLYKSSVPKMLNSLGVYDRNINSSKHKFIIPMYHRIIQDTIDDPYKLGMCVLENTFEKQLKYFSENFTSISLDDYVLNRQSLEATKKAYVSLTFDDGYLDNLTIALPLIKKYKLNTTIFICTKIFNDKSNYWWDSVINSFKASNKNIIDISDLGLGDLSNIINLKNDQSKIIRQLLSAIWKSNKYKDKGFIQEIINRLLDGQSEPLVGHLTEDQVVELHKAGINIGAHTLSHPNLTSLKLDDARYELDKSKSILGSILNCDITGLAYPAGFKNDDIIRLVQDLGFNYAVSTDSGVNYLNKSFALERIGMPETNLPDFKRCLSHYSKLS